MMQPEKQIQNDIMGWLQAKGVFRFQINNSVTFDRLQGRYRKKNRWYVYGVSDIVGIYKNRFLAIEVKTGKGRASIHQKLFLQDVINAGGIALIARSVEDLEKQLGEVDEGLLASSDVKSSKSS